MNKTILEKHLNHFKSEIKKNPDKFNEDFKQRMDETTFYRSYTEKKIMEMNIDEIYIYISRLWAMLIWGNKHYVVDKLIEKNGLDKFRKYLANLVWGKETIEKRWDEFRKEITGMGPAMISEILCKTHPDKYMLWNRRAYVALNYLGVKGLPTYDYQITGKMFLYLCNVCKEIGEELKKQKLQDTSLLAVDYFIWDELQTEKVLERIDKKQKTKNEEEIIIEQEESKFIHNDIRDKLSEIGEWLGFKSKIEIKVADGSKVDAIWEATIGNMGRVIYVFEVQTKGSIDSLLLNLLKALNNSAVQGIVAVSDKEQIEKIRKHAEAIKDLKDTLKYWDYEKVLEVHSRLEYVNSTVNELGLVPQGF